MDLDASVSTKFFKATEALPFGEKILANFKCQIEADLTCSGSLFVGKQAIYFHAKMNYKTLLGKSTKIRLWYKDIRLVSSVKFDQLAVNLKNVRPIGQDLRSTGDPSYKLLKDYVFGSFKPGQLDECLELIQQQI